MSKGLNVLKLVVALVLLVGICVGLFFGGRWAINKLDSIFVKDTTLDEDGHTKLPTDTDAPSGGQTQTPSGDQTEELKAHFYVDEVVGSGYSTVGNVTFFFKVFDKSFYEEARVLNCWAYNYALYDTVFAYSSDGVLWQDFGYYNASLPGFEGTVNLSLVEDEFYVNYTSITNCSNPLEKLNELNQNVFGATSVFGYEFSHLLG